MVAARTLLHSLVATAVATSLVLVVPTAAVATTVATSITLTVKTSPIPWHGTATLTGRLSKGSAHTALGGRKVTLDGRNAGTTTWHALLTHTTSSTGGFSFSLTNRSVNQNFRVRFAGTSTLRASVSPIRTELVRPPLTNLAQNPASSTATTGEDRTWTGTTAAVLSGKPVRLQEYAGTWSTVASSTVSSTGGFVLHHVLAPAGVHTFRVFVPATTILYSIAGPATNVTVADPPAIAPDFLPTAQTGIGYAYAVRVVHGTPPYTWTQTGGTAPTGLTFDAATGLVAGVPGSPSTGTLSLHVEDATGQSADAVLPWQITLPADWPLAGHDLGQTRSNAADSTLQPEEFPSFRAERTTSALDQVAVAGGILYAAGPLPDSHLRGIAATDLVTGATVWATPVTFHGNGEPCSSLSVGASVIVCATQDQVVGVARSDGHQVWSTADTDPGHSYANSPLVVTPLVAVVSEYTGNTVAAYSLADGTLLWSRPAPSDASHLVADQQRVYLLGYDHVVRTYSLVSGTGTPGWTAAVTDSFGLLRTGTDLLLVQPHGATILDTATGGVAGTMTTTHEIQFASDVVTDGASAFFAYAGFGDFGVDETGVVAFDLGTGQLMWDRPIHVPGRDGEVAPYGGAVLSGGLLFVHLRGLIASGDPTVITALDPTSGLVTGYRTEPDQVIDSIAGDGRLVLLGYQHTEVYGVMVPQPSLPAQALPVGWSGQSYLGLVDAVGGTAPYSFAITAGSTPTGITLAANGSLSGTPSGASSRFTVAVTDALGRISATREFGIEVRTAGTATWPTDGGDLARTGWAGSEHAINSDSIAAFALRWASAAIGTTTNVGPGTEGQSPIVAGAPGSMRAFLVDGAGTLRGYDVSTGTTGQAPLWSGSLTAGDYFRDVPTLVGSTLYVASVLGTINAVNAGDGTVAWSAALPHNSGLQGRDAPVVVGGLVVVEDAGRVMATKLSDHTSAWDVAVPGAIDSQDVSLATDGTRIYAFADCTAYALDVADGGTAWSVSTLLPGETCNPIGTPGRNAPVVRSGLVYAATSEFSTEALDATTGDVVWRTNVGHTYTAPAVSDEVVVYNDNFFHLVSAVDSHTGALLWETSLGGRYAAGSPTLVGDLVLVHAFDDSGAFVIALDLVSGQEVWQSSPIGIGNPGGIAVAGGRIWYHTTEAAGSRLVGLGPP